MKSSAFVTIVAGIVALAYGAASAATPTVDAGTDGATATSTSHTATLPACASGKLLVAVITPDNAGAPISNVTAGWTKINNLSDTATFGTVRTETYYKFSSGADSLSYDTGASVPTSYIIRCFGGAHASAAPEGSSALATGTSVNPDPATSGAVSWGTDTNLFCFFAAFDRGGSGAAHSAYSSGYTTDQRETSTETAGAAAHSGCKAASADSDDPGTSTISASDNWLAGTYVIRPASTQSQSPRSMHQYRLRR